MVESRQLTARHSHLTVAPSRPSRNTLFQKLGRSPACQIFAIAAPHTDNLSDGRPNLFAFFFPDESHAALIELRRARIHAEVFAIESNQGPEKNPKDSISGPLIIRHGNAKIDFQHSLAVCAYITVKPRIAP